MNLEQNFNNFNKKEKANAKLKNYKLIIKVKDLKEIFNIFYT